MTITKSKSLKKPKAQKLSTRTLAILQRLGKALLYPVAMLPLAAIFLRLGTEIPDTTVFSHWIKDAFSIIGGAAFNHLAIIFGVGVAFGFTKDQRGEAAITAMVFYFAMQMVLGAGNGDFVEKIYHGVQLSSATISDGHGGVYAAANGGYGFHAIFDLPNGVAADGSTTYAVKYDTYLADNVFTGIIGGSVIAWIYNRFNGIELPSVLGFFSGRRLIPVLAFLAAWVFGLAYAIIFPWVGAALYYIGKGMSSATGDRWGRAGIQLAYGTINRLLLGVGLHNVVNVPLWFSPMGGAFESAADHTQQVFGDINIFLNGSAKDIHGVANPSGAFQAGFFPIMMFGLPTVAFVIWKNAEPGSQKRKVASVFAASALVSFFTGITEPIEYSFMFLAPALYAIHAVLTGIFGFIVGLFGIQLGFGFSAGFTDYLLSIPKSMDIIRANKTGVDAVMANPGWLFAIGAVTSATYYYSMNFAIKKFNIETPGRGKNRIGDDSDTVAPIAEGDNKYTADSKRILLAVGGTENVESLGNCATRLRFVLKDNTIVDSELIKKTKAMGQMKVAGGYQVIMGPTVEMFAEETHRLMKSGADLSSAKLPTKTAAPKTTKAKAVNVDVKSVASGTVATLASLKDGVFSEGVLGDGLVVKLAPSTKKASICAPVSGELVTAFPTGHAYGIRTKDGAEILIHIGLDTVNLDGKGFTPAVKQGQHVEAGDVLVEVNVEEVRKNAPSADPIVLITSGQKALAKAKGKVTKSTKLFSIK